MMTRNLSRFLIAGQQFWITSCFGFACSKEADYRHQKHETNQTWNNYETQKKNMKHSMKHKSPNFANFKQLSQTHETKEISKWKHIFNVDSWNFKTLFIFSLPRLHFKLQWVAKDERAVAKDYMAAAEWKSNLRTNGQGSLSVLIGLFRRRNFGENLPGFRRPSLSCIRWWPSCCTFWFCPWAPTSLNGQSLLVKPTRLRSRRMRPKLDEQEKDEADHQNQHFHHNNTNKQSSRQHQSFNARTTTSNRQDHQQRQHHSKHSNHQDHHQCKHHSNQQDHHQFKHHSNHQDHHQFKHHSNQQDHHQCNKHHSNQQDHHQCNTHHSNHQDHHQFKHHSNPQDHQQYNHGHRNIQLGKPMLLKQLRMKQLCNSSCCTTNTNSSSSRRYYMHSSSTRQLNRQPHCENNSGINSKLNRQRCMSSS